MNNFIRITGSIMSFLCMGFLFSYALDAKTSFIAEIEFTLAVFFMICGFYSLFGDL
jgi:hypothetical protein